MVGRGRGALADGGGGGRRVWGREGVWRRGRDEWAGLVPVGEGAVAACYVVFDWEYLDGAALLFVERGAPPAQEE